MSSFINSAEHFNAIQRNSVSFLSKSDFYYTGDNLDSKDSKFISEKIASIVETLIELNVTCFYLQYKTMYAGKVDTNIAMGIETLKYQRSRKAKDLTAHGLYNAIRCLNYQIEIDHLEDIRPLTDAESEAMDFMESMSNSLARYIVNNLPEDKTCTWSL